jgi:ribonuclease HII
MKFPSFSFEKKLWRKGFKLVAGTDEVGRGSFAGPVMAGCVVFEKKTKTSNGIKINDSKKLRPLERRKASKWIKQNALAWGIGGASVSVINRIGMAKATKMAFRQAINDANRRLGGRIDFLLIDAFFIPYVRGLKRKNQQAIINGDGKSFSIAAASIIAKVERDKEMLRFSRKYPKYGWGRNKGYGTRQHQEALKKFGITRHHRKAFVSRFI